MFTLVDAPTQFPGRELMGLNSPEGVIDTGVDFNGWVYLGRQTVHEAATLFGYAAPDDVQALRARLLALERENGDLARRIADLDPVVRLIHNAAAELVPAA